MSKAENTLICEVCGSEKQHVHRQYFMYRCPFQYERWHRIKEKEMQVV